ncbi:MAG TPA: putative porin [Bacteroidales bacterium]|nr:putative porin [Bacteroidales bacterium]
MRKSLLIVVVLAGTLMLQAQKADTTRHHVTRQWKLSDDYTEEVPVSLDTAFSLFHRYRLAERNSWFNAYPGNYGQPLYQVNFFDRINDPDRYLYRYLYPFMHTPENALFINTQVPFTEMVFNYAGPRDRAEQTFRVRHSQNINRFMNFGLVYDITYSLGQYSYQRANDKTFALHYSYTGEKYKAYAQLGINSFIDQENGGIINFSQLPTYNTKDVEVNLSGLDNAQTTLKNWNILLVQRYRLERKVTAVRDSARRDSGKVITAKDPFFNGTFSHILTLEKGRRSYTDSYPGSGFYENVFMNSDLTFDTLSMRILKNTLRFDFSTNEKRKFRLGGGFGIRNELYKYFQETRAEAPYLGLRSWQRSNTLAVGRLFNNIGKKLRWEAEGEFYLNGYRAGDFNASGLVSKSFDFSKGPAIWNITGGIFNTSPSEWIENWVSNNFRWNNSFGKEFGFKAGTDFQFPSRRMSLRFDYSIIHNFIYFGPDALPAQNSGALSVLSAQARKEFSVWKLHLDNQLMVQVSSNKNILDLPLVSARSAGFFEHNFHFRITNGNLLTQLGVEALYYTGYHGYSWMPATGVYYQQASVVTGNYPYLNAFLNVKLKRTRIFLMLDHLNSKMSGYNYFLVPGYPLNIRCFRYGLAWTFYD